MKQKTLLFCFAFLAAFFQLGAQSWKSLESNTDSTLLDVYFVNTDVGYVSGVNGIVLKTINGGQTWSALNTGVTDGLACIRFIDESTGYAAGGFAQSTTIIKTTDGGSSWSKITVASLKFGSGMWFVSADTGFYAYADALYGASTIAKTTDGGASWKAVHSASGWVSYFYFTDSKHGYATVNNGTVIKTTDGGENWTSSNLGVKNWGSGIFFFSKDEGIVGGKTNTSAAMFITSDGGANWTPVTSENMIFKIFFADRNNGYALSVDNTGASVSLIHSSDGGNTWNPVTTPESRLRGLFFSSKDLGYAVGDAGIILKYSLQNSSSLENYRNTKISIYPNPMQEEGTILLGNELLGRNISVRICNVLGSSMQVNSRSTGDRIIIERSGLPVGFYFLELKDKTGIIGKGSFIIK
jgi:photosystem II stability/assembly factor-like uncharacterized protein